MTATTSVCIATSLDGFIARKNGGIHWLLGGGSSQDYGYAEFISTIPVLIGEGLPLFGTLNRDVTLELLKSEAFPKRFVRSKYKVR